MAILINNKQNRYQLPIKKICQIAQILLNDLGCPNSDLSILIVRDVEISRLNSIYLNKNYSTNVLAFPMLEGSFSKINPELMGDVVISVDTANREAYASGKIMLDWFVELLIHGILHLVGYDHLKSENEAIRMNKMSDRLLLSVKKNIVFRDNLL